jgi:hypothetical protein
MTKKRHFERASQGCQACGRPWTPGQVRKSKEHILGNWFSGLEANHPPEHSSYSGGFEYDESKNALVEARGELVHRRSGLLTRKTGEICAECNNGWMSALELAVKPIIMSLAHSARTGLAIPLDYKARRQLALWAEKTALTDELASNRLPVGTVSMFETLRTGQPLRGSMVWIARNHADYDIKMALAQVDVSATPIPRVGPPDRRALLAEIVYHYITIVVFMADSPGQTGPSLSPALWTMVWPALGRTTVFYPPTSVVHGSEIEAVLTKPQRWIPTIHTEIRRSDDAPMVRNRS